MKYQCVILCPDSDAGYKALHEYVQDGWEPIICYTTHSVAVRVESFWSSNQYPQTSGPSNHIVLRKKVQKAKRGTAK